jgi:hypothetical protein
MQVRVFSKGDYWAVEVYNENGQILIRVGFDREPTQEGIGALIQ